MHSLTTFHCCALQNHNSQSSSHTCKFTKQLIRVKKKEGRTIYLIIIITINIIIVIIILRKAKQVKKREK